MYYIFLYWHYCIGHLQTLRYTLAHIPVVGVLSVFQACFYLAVAKLTFPPGIPGRNVEYASFFHTLVEESPLNALI